MNRNVPIIESIGIEFESEHICPGTFKADKFQEGSDASIESVKNFIVIGKSFVEIEDKTNLFKAVQKRVGVEYISTILDTSQPETFIPIVDNFLDKISQLEPEEGQRSGIHIHVACPYNLTILKNALILGAHLEELFFSIGSMGNKQRGETNDSIYSRPITKYGPTVVKDGRERDVQCFTIENCLGSKSTKDFWKRYGDQNEVSPDGKYIPIRYHWLCLYTLLTKGTIEFRVFNKTLNPQYLLATVELCKRFVEFIIRNELNEDDFPQHSVFDLSPKELILDTLERFCQMAKIEGNHLYTLGKIIKRSKPVELKTGFVYTHLLTAERMRTRPHFTDPMNYGDLLVIRELIRNPDYIDIHRQQRNNGERLPRRVVEEGLVPRMFFNEEDHNEEDHDQDEE